MKLLTVIFALILAVSGRIFNNPSIEKYVNSAETYQSGLEHQQSGLYSSQSNQYTGHEVANTRPDGKKTAKTLSYHAENEGHHYRYAYETDNGIRVQEEGKIEKGTSAHGAFSFKGDDGHEYTITYTADENGFRPSGDHLPTSPPIPEAILKSLEKNAKDEAAGIFDDGKYHEHQEPKLHEHQQIESGHQSLEFHSSGNSGANSAYFGQAATQESNLGHQESSSQSSASSSYYSPSSQYESSSASSSSGQGFDSGYGSSSGFAPSLGHQSSSGLESSLGHQYTRNEASLGYQSSSGNEGNLGHQYSESHGAMNYQSALGQGSGFSSGNYRFRTPSGFVSSASHGGSAGHFSGMSYLPPPGYHRQ
ncbi:unnamed protein product [Arctia plantaginis]|uniref:Uncharacterized protein n=1 Tax=Arctia plantaginis TaxID=874455 RepID=A0A8S1BJN6_ARCPL|nr:unnamed protein product [Arctia plantaginis]